MVCTASKMYNVLESITCIFHLQHHSSNRFAVVTQPLILPVEQYYAHNLEY